jgi:hypothetical protein
MSIAATGVRAQLAGGFRRPGGSPLMAVAACVAVAALGGAAFAGNPHVYQPAEPERTRAMQYAATSDEFCLAELVERGVPFERLLAGEAGGTAPPRSVATPIRLTGPVRGVHYRQTARPELDPKAPATILDCCLALALDDLSGVLAAHGVVEIEYLSMYRTGFTPPGVRHPAGRAIDVAVAKLADGTRYNVEHHFFGRPGAQTCGPGAEAPRREHPGAIFWRQVACELDRLRSFNLVLTPNYDWGHRDHLHLEVRSGISWFLTE